MSVVFGVSGPKDVEVLAYPTRHRADVSAASAVPRQSIISDVDISDEHLDRFDASPDESAEKMRNDPRTQQGTASSFRGRDVQRWLAPSSHVNQSKLTTSQRFAQPLVSEGAGSVFPVELPLSKRRGFEVDIIQRYDRLNISTQHGEFWFVIDAVWMRQWVDFVMEKGDPPGPISNYNLFTQLDTYSPARRASMLVKHAADARSRSGAMAARPDLKIKGGLHKVRDYRVVHPMVWYIFREMYSADDAPEICRWKADIYSGEVTATRKLKLEEEMHTKAVYELRKFCSKIKDGMSPLSSQRMV